MKINDPHLNYHLRAGAVIVASLVLGLVTADAAWSIFAVIALGVLANVPDPLEGDEPKPPVVVVNAEDLPAAPEPEAPTPTQTYTERDVYAAWQFDRAAERHALRIGD